MFELYFYYFDFLHHPFTIFSIHFPLYLNNINHQMTVVIHFHHFNNIHYKSIQLAISLKNFEHYYGH